MPNEIGRATRLVGSNDFCIKCRGRHFRIRESDARRLLSGQRETDIYSLQGYTRQGTIQAGKDFYRLKLNYEPVFSHMNRFNLLISGAYWFSPIIDHCREVAKL